MTFADQLNAQEKGIKASLSGSAEIRKDEPDPITDIDKMPARYDGR
ncbi:hypothetical protein [Pseudomonas prosekii]